jgi:hypothetical protein
MQPNGAAAESEIRRGLKKIIYGDISNRHELRNGCVVGLGTVPGNIPSRRLFLNHGSLAWGEDKRAAIAVGELVTTNTA